MQCRGVCVRAEHVEPLLYRSCRGRLAMPDAVDLLKAEIHDEAEAEVDPPGVGDALRRGGKDRCRARPASAHRSAGQDRHRRINEKIAKLERRQQDAERLRVFEDIPLGRPEAADAVKKMSPDRFRAVRRRAGASP